MVRSEALHFHPLLKENNQGIEYTAPYDEDDLKLPLDIDDVLLFDNVSNITHKLLLKTAC